MEDSARPHKRQRTQSHPAGDNGFLLTTETKAQFDGLLRQFPAARTTLDICLEILSLKSANDAYARITPTTFAPGTRERIEYSRYLTSCKERELPESFVEILGTIRAAQQEMDGFAARTKQLLGQRGTSAKAPTMNTAQQAIFRDAFKALQNALIAESTRNNVGKYDVDPGMRFEAALDAIVKREEREQRLGQMGLTEAQFFSEIMKYGRIESAMHEGACWIKILPLPPLPRHRQASSSERGSSAPTTMSLQSKREGSSMTDGTTPLPGDCQVVTSPDVMQISPPPGGVHARRRSSVMSTSSRNSSRRTSLVPKAEVTETNIAAMDFRTPPLPQTDHSSRKSMSPAEILPATEMLPTTAEPTERASPAPEAVELMDLIDQCLLALHTAQKAVDPPNAREILETMSRPLYGRIVERAKSRSQRNDQCLVELLDFVSSVELVEKDGFVGWRLTEKGRAKISPLLAAQDPPRLSGRRASDTPRQQLNYGRQPRSRTQSYPQAAPRANSAWDLRPLLPLICLKAWGKAGWIDSRTLEDEFRLLKNYKRLFIAAQVDGFRDYAMAVVDAGLLDVRRDGDGIVFFNLTEMGEQNRQ